MTQQHVIPTTLDRPFDSTRAAGPRAIRVGLLGCGNVGGAVARALLGDRGAIESAAGAPIELARVAVAHPFKPRSVTLPPGVVTTDSLSVACDVDIDVVIEAIGGIDPARALVEAAIGDGKSVITANKDLLARHGEELIAAAERKGVHLFYEGAAGAAIPIVRCLSESLSGTRLRRITAILNGTTNFILTEMEERGRSLRDALAEAQRRGYAEADPSADVTGHDAACKALLLARAASGDEPTLGRVEGITHVDRRAVEAAVGDGCSIKLVADVDLGQSPPRVAVTVQSLAADHPLGRVRGVDNGVVVETAEGARLFFSGPGAGGDATAVAIIGDLVRVAKERTEARDAHRLVCA